MTVQETKRQLATQLNDAQAKYTYFLLAVAASAIAWAIQRTTGHSLEWQMIPLGLAVLSWAGSFWCGCRNRAYFSSTLYANLALLDLQDGSHPKTPSHPDAIQAACAGVCRTAEQNSTSANFWGRLQFRLLVAGAVLFLLWHVMEMEKTRGTDAPKKALQSGYHAHACVDMEWEVDFRHDTRRGHGTRLLDLHRRQIALAGKSPHPTAVPGANRAAVFPLFRLPLFPIIAVSHLGVL